MASGESLEVLVEQEDEIRLAMESVRDASVLTDKIENEDIVPVVEQQLDTKSYENTSYEVHVGYDGSASKSYYEDLTAASSENGAAYSAFVEYDHESVQESQKVADAAREAEFTNKFYIENRLDSNVKDARDDIKLFSPATWQLMWYGKITFN